MVSAPLTRDATVVADPSVAVVERRLGKQRQAALPTSLPRMKPRGELAIVLHTHMPYVEGFGTWPFGEEWLWEAIATSYLPLLDVLEEYPGRVTLSMTPVLCDQ